MITRLLATFALPLSLASGALAQSPDPAPASAPVQPPSTAQLPFVGSVSAADPRAQAAGMAMLWQGGSATDAALATMLALTVVEPQSSGIGGGGFYVRGTADGGIETIDGRETAPSGATPDWFLAEDGSVPPFMQSVMSGSSVGVPGNIALAAEAHARYGKLPWAALFAPAIELAREGFAINIRLASYLERMPERAGAVPATQALFYDDGGQPHPAGHIVRNEPLAQTLERIAAEGAAAFYTGALAQEIAGTVAGKTPRDTAMTPADIADYRAVDRDGVCGSYRGYRVCGMGPPSSGGIAVLQILGQLERFDLAGLGLYNPQTWHLFVESQRLAYADRELYIADSDFVAVPVAGLIDPAYIVRRSELISIKTSLAAVAPGRPAGADTALADGNEPEERGTSHIAAVDPTGTMISYTSTIEGVFGSGMMAGGFYLNNELTDFSRSPTVDGLPVANRVEGGKRPRSSMAPTVVWDPEGRPVLVIGAAGGPTIPVQTARGIIGVIDFGLFAKEALGLPFIMGFGDTVMVEEGTWLETAIPALQELGHSEVVPREVGLKAGAIKREGTIWEAARDPRIDLGVTVP
ncbi:gamma-glutamyltransferase [Erythrobacter sp. QSSC1-22B]|uniref:gamma-glutamyltransferase n=1 Tax=Erythrobacter sp. QSSC1-22B TaxID=1860125 RepID=UPI00080517C5|nr:gamma-glutamyltransferase [Erythrobacter sp. QSSC1-22B]OBX20030.1 gamma-glutamyltransferase [Erythrobacter sp. QSSC1-22B]